MNWTNLQDTIQGVISRLYPEARDVELVMEKPPQPEFGDIAIPVAFSLARIVKRNPIEIAREIADNLTLNARFFDPAETRGGFINLTYSRSFLMACLRDINRDIESFRSFNLGNGVKTQVEFVSANPTGPLTVGHGRQAVLGETLANLLSLAGYKVTREYYFNNTGRQIRFLGDSVRLRYKELNGEPVDFPDDYYQGEYIVDLAQKFRDQFGSDLSDKKHLPLFEKFAAEQMMNQIKNTLEQIGIKYDSYFNENQLIDSGKLKEVLEQLEAKDLSYLKDGALWARTSQLGLDQDRVLIKSTGEPTYRLLDIVYHKDKFDRGFQLIVDVFGADHQSTYPDVLAVVGALGYDVSRIKVVIHQFVTLTRGGETIKMSTRKANFVTLDELVEEVGPEATRFFFILRSANSHLNFDLEVAKSQSDENPVFYVQYGCARISSIIRFAQNKDVPLLNPEEIEERILNYLDSPEEHNLIKMLIEYPQVIRKAAIEFNPHLIPQYLIDLSKLFHPFYHDYRVVSGDLEQSMARLFLVNAVREVLRDGLNILGISAPEKM
ncbi:arginine--tRNA ligase [bacterium]|nr:arginine--tRNA ligase [bacterium]